MSEQKPTTHQLGRPPKLTNVERYENNAWLPDDGKTPAIAFVGVDEHNVPRAVAGTCKCFFSEPDCPRHIARMYNITKHRKSMDMTFNA
jgi:hypothetical protein